MRRTKDESGSTRSRRSEDELQRDATMSRWQYAEKVRNLAAPHLESAHRLRDITSYSTMVRTFRDCNIRFLMRFGRFVFLYVSAPFLRIDFHRRASRCARFSDDASPRDLNFANKYRPLLLDRHTHGKLAQRVGVGN